MAKPPRSNEQEDPFHWITNRDWREFVENASIPSPWFPAYQIERASDRALTLYSALIPVPLIGECLDDGSWDFSLLEGTPSIWTHYEKGEPSKHVYTRFGTERGIEPIVVYREFYGMRANFMELNQEFSLYHNLFHEPGKHRFIKFDSQGDESEAVRYTPDRYEIKTSLLLKFCAVKEMALAIFIESFRHSTQSLAQLRVEKDRREQKKGEFWCYHSSLIKDTLGIRKEFQTVGGFSGKKYFLPPAFPAGEEQSAPERYHDFIIETDAAGNAIRHTCDPSQLADYFGKNPKAPHYLTPVFFRAEVLSKYYSNPQKYSVEDGYLRCGSLWGLRMVNDHIDYVSVFLGDLGRELSESERDYWLSFNIPPEGRSISKTTFRRGFLAEPTNPEPADLVFKHQYARFHDDFRARHGWDFFLPLHAHDEHFLTGLRLPTGDNQAEFDSQLLALTKLLVDSLNESEIAKHAAVSVAGARGITKLDHFLRAQGFEDYGSHIGFLRALQDLRSTSAAHRKGSNYDSLVKALRLADEGQQRVFAVLLQQATSLLEYLRSRLIPAGE